MFEGESHAMRCLAFCCAFWVPLCSWPAILAAQEWVTIGKDALAFHETAFRSLRIKIEPTVVSDVEIFVELLGIPNVAKINSLHLQIRRSLGLKNAAAYFENDYRSIVYDPNWAASASVEFYLVLGHEAGHHVCEHTIGKVRSTPWEAELEADRFGGASIKRFETYHNRKFFENVLAAATARYPEQGSTLYPSRAARLDALRAGYEQGSPCGDLAPVTQPGYSRTPR